MPGTIKDLKDYIGILPYASELFGVYQPLIGWKSKLIKERYDKSRTNVYDNVVSRLGKLRSPVTVDLVNDKDQGADMMTIRGQKMKIQHLAPLKFLDRMANLPRMSLRRLTVAFLA